MKIAFGESETEFATTSLANPEITGSDVCEHSVLGEAGCTELGCNPDYLIEMVDALDAETIEIGCGKSEDPILLRAASFDDRAVVIMPMRV